MTDKQMLKLVVERLQKAEAEVRDLKSQVRIYSLESEKAKGGLQVRKESQSHVEGLRDAVLGLLNVIENNHEPNEFDKTLTFAKKVLFLTEGASF